MSVIKFDRDFETLFNWDTDENPTTEQDYQNAVKNWTETEMNIVDTLLWQPTTEYATGNIVKTPSLPSQYVLRCAETGTSGSTEPSYSGASVGDSVTDGTVEWVIVSLATGNAADVDASNIGVNAEVDNSEAWASAIGGGAIAEDDGRLVKGGTVYAVTSVMETNIATNTEAIGDNAEAIATNTANITQNTTDIDIADKRISNIEKLLQGNLYDYQTDSNSAYTKTVPAGAMPYASLDEVGGKTVVWNQTVPIISTGWTLNRCTLTLTDDVYEMECTSNAYAFFGIYRNTEKMLNGHKYYYSCEFKVNTTTMPTTFELCSNIGADDVTAQNTWQTYKKVYSATSEISNAINPTIRYSSTADVTVGDKVSVRNMMKIDLTLMYGAGNEPSTVAEFTAQFPAPYYAFNQGSLLSAGVTEVVSKKADTTTLATYPIPAEVQALEGYGWSAGNVYNYIDYERKVFVQRVGSVQVESTDTHTFGVSADGNGRGLFTMTNLGGLNGGTSVTAVNQLCDKLITTNASNVYNHGLPLSASLTNDGGGVYLTASSTQNTSALYDTWLASLGTVTLYYPLATPIETDISAYLTDDNLIEVEAGGTLTFPNANGDNYRIPVPSAETYMVDLQEAI